MAADPDVVAAVSAAEAGAAVEVVAAIVLPWSWNANENHWFRIINGVAIIVTKQEMLSWEKAQRVDGKDLARGMKLNACLDAILAARPGA